MSDTMYVWHSGRIASRLANWITQKQRIYKQEHNVYAARSGHMSDSSGSVAYKCCISHVESIRNIEAIHGITSRPGSASAACSNKETWNYSFGI